MLTETPAAAHGTQCFALSMFADCTAMAPLAPIFAYTMLAKPTPIALLTEPLVFSVNAIKFSPALFADPPNAAVLANATSSAILASVTMYFVLAHTGTLTFCTICPATTVVAYAFASAFLALVLYPAVRTRRAFRVALLANAFVFAVLTYAAATTWFACSAYTTVITNTFPATIFAQVLVPTVTAKLLSATILATALHSTVVTNTTATTHGASTANPSVFTQTAAAAILAQRPLFGVFAHCSGAAVSTRRLITTMWTQWFAVYWFGRLDETTKITLALSVSILPTLPDAACPPASTPPGLPAKRAHNLALRQDTRQETLFQSVCFRVFVVSILTQAPLKSLWLAAQNAFDAGFAKEVTTRKYVVQF